MSSIAAPPKTPSETLHVKHLNVQQVKVFSGTLERINCNVVLQRMWNKKAYCTFNNIGVTLRLPLLMMLRLKVPHKLYRSHSVHQTEGLDISSPKAVGQGRVKKVVTIWRKKPDRNRCQMTQTCLKFRHSDGQEKTKGREVNFLTGLTSRGLIEEQEVVVGSFNKNYGQWSASRQHYHVVSIST